ncbi:MAG TPA: hypothetical protein VK177_16840 [Flavobacteriales bacterium]|nr:hypothetical protein [Flavobacteriales bacterium]
MKIQDIEDLYQMVLEPSKEVSGLNKKILSILESSNCKIEFLSKVKNEIEELITYKFSDIHLLPEELQITLENYYLFQSKLSKIKNEIDKINPTKIRGRIVSHKNEIAFDFLFEYYLDYISTYGGLAYIFDIWEEGRENFGKFSFQLRVMENGQDLKVVDLYPDSQKHYLGKGISIAIILHSKELFNKRIISSSNKKKSFEGEANWQDAIEKVWKRLENNSLAGYDKENDFYYLV